VARVSGDLSRVGRSLLRTARDPVVWVFVLAATFEVLTGDPLGHALLLYAVAAVLVGDGIRHRSAGAAVVTESSAAPGPAPTARPGGKRPPRALLVAGGLLYAIAVGSFRRYTYPMTVAVGIPAAAAVVWAWRAPPREARQDEHRLDPLGAALWLAVFVGAALWELAALLFQPSLTVSSSTHPTLSVLFDPALSHHPGRSVGLAVWLAIAWFLVER
jgi:hypothetical protein